MRWLSLWAHRTSSRSIAPCLHELILFGTGREPELAAQFPTHVEVPALRERGRGDIIQLVELVLRRFSPRDRPPPELSAETLERLCARAWPGNVRALKNTIERAVLLHELEGRSLDELLASSE